MVEVTKQNIKIDKQRRKLKQELNTKNIDGLVKATRPFLCADKNKHLASIENNTKNNASCQTFITLSNTKFMTISVSNKLSYWNGIVFIE